MATVSVPEATSVFLSNYLKGIPNVALHDVKPVCFTGRLLSEILDKSADFLAEKLNAMSMDDVYWEDSHDAYAAIPMSSKRSVNMIMVSGGPGCGKTEVIKNICRDVENCTVMVPFKRLQSDYKNGERSFTQYKCVSRDMLTNLLLVDEFTGCDIGLVCAAAIRQKCSEVILWGDVMQTWLSDSEGVGFKDFKISCAATLYSNYRNPPATVKLLNKLFSDSMVAMRSDDDSSIQVEQLYGTEIFDGVNLTGSRLSVEELKDMDLPAITVRSAQGATYDDVNLFVFHRDLNIFTSSSIVRVALSRHRHNLTIYTVDPVAFTKLVSTGRLVNDHLVGLDLYEANTNSGWFSSFLAKAKCLLLGL
jgi:hypothetical protein